MILKYRKKPVVIEAVQWTGVNMYELSEFTNNAVTYFTKEMTWNDWDPPKDLKLYIPTLEGKMEISLNDYVIRGINGEYYPCKPDVFEKTYELEEV